MITASRVQSYFVAVCKSHNVEPLQWTVEEILKCENLVLDQLNYNLIIFQPFRSLRHLLVLFHLEDFLPSCTYPLSFPSALENDSFFTFNPLLYPPHLIALTAVYMICIFNSINPEETFRRIQVDMGAIRKICSSLCRFYDRGMEPWPKTITDSIIVLSQQFKS